MPPHGEGLVLYAACTPGLEEALAGELRDLGASDVNLARGGARFRGDERLLAASLLRLRSAVKVSRLLAAGGVRDARDLGELSASVDWRRSLRPGQTIACEAAVRDSCFNHSGYAALVVKDGLVDRLRRDLGARPDVDVERPDLTVRAVIKGDYAELWRDECGASLHKRGYRSTLVRSPLNEATAAGMLLLAGYDGTVPLADPLCGSGTFVIEAALLARRRAPGLVGREYAYERRPDFSPSAFEDARRAAIAAELPAAPVKLEGSDRHPGATALARRDAIAAGVGDDCEFVRADAAERTPANGARIVFANPPWGLRLEEEGDPGASWRALGDYLRRLPGATAYVLCGNPELPRRIGMKSSRRFPVRAGQLDCRLLRYEVRPEGARTRADEAPERADEQESSPPGDGASR
jgi:putative N6-adenine-specific DNA methylase